MQKKWISILAMALLWLSSPSLWGKEKPLILVTGSKKGTYYTFGKTLKKLVKQKGLALDIRTSSGSMANLMALTIGQADLAFCQTDVFWKMFSNPSTHQLFKNLRIVLPLYREEVHILIRKNSSIHSLRDLAGKTMGAGALDSGSLISAQRLLKMDGVGAVLWDYSPPREGLKKLLRGQIDGLFFTGGQPLSLLSKLPLPKRKKLTFLALDSKIIKKIQKRYPFYNKAFLLPKNYPFLSKKIQTIAVPSLLITTKYVEHSKITALCSSLYANLPKLKKGHPKWREVTFARARRMAAQPSLPFHQSARAYLLREVLTPDTLRFASGSKGGTYYQIALDLQRALLSRGIKLLPLPSKGSFSNVISLVMGQSDLALCQMDSLTFFRVKSPKLFDQLGILLPLYLEELHILVRRGSGISSLADLKGKRVNIGSVASGTASTMTFVLGLNRINARKDLRLDLSPSRVALKKLLRGKLDCIFFVGGRPLSMLSKLPPKASQKIRMLSLQKKQFQRMKSFFLRLDLPFPYRWVKIPAHTYPWQAKGVTTLATPALILARRGQKEKALFSLIETIFKSHNSFSHPKWKSLDFEKIRRLLSKFPIVTHQAMERYVYQRNLKKIQIHFTLFNKALSRYQKDVKKFPMKLMALVKPSEKVRGWKGPYLKKLPRDPWGHPYIIRVPGRWGMDFEVVSLGLDGKKNGSGRSRDISSWEGNVWIGQSRSLGGEKFSPDEREGDSEGE